MSDAEIGIIGLGVMGRNLARNIAGNGHRILVYNRHEEKTRKFISDHGGENIAPAFSLAELIEKVGKPAKIMLMVSASAVDDVIDQLLPYLQAGDMVIDGGNSHYRDTERRSKELAAEEVYYLGTGISGGEYGALHGPSIMPGGSREAYDAVEDIFLDAAAETEEGRCVTYLGRGGSGHFVKMIHNGIEYGIMQIIAECFDIMRKYLKMKPEEMSRTFHDWNEKYDFYLLDITWQILRKKDPETGDFLINMILDRAQQKGTGRWSVQEALEFGVPVPLMAAAVNARLISAQDKERKQAPAADIPAGYRDEEELILKELESAFYFTAVYAYAEGMKVLQAAAEEYNYDYSLAEVARIWGGGCIIRASLLKRISNIYKNKIETANFIFSEEFRSEIEEKSTSLKGIIQLAANYSSLPLPAMSAVLNYYDSMRAENLPANLIQAQRDYFGAHTYRRIDKEGVFHTEWQDMVDAD
ncbi:MAG: NADP-dependent phosphogluconate dehydrogenase, partial [Halanaerobiaceae bacterium]